jgi:serine/threonine-protein kinase
MKRSNSRPKEILPGMRTTPGWRERVFGQRARALPDDLLRDASHRLQVIALLFIVLWIVGTVLYRLDLHLQDPAGDRWISWQGDDNFTIAGVLVAVAFWLFSRKPDRDPKLVIDLGLVFLVLTSFIIAMMIHWAPMPHGIPVGASISWLGVMVLIFAAIIPSSPRKTIVAGLIAVSMNPLAMLVAQWRGVWTGRPINIVLMHYDDYLLVIVSVVIATVVRRLGQQVAQARELGSYQLGELIGSGGMGQVYRATHRMLARPAAIKLIRAEMVGEGSGEAAQLALKRFRREAEAAASLRSPHTVELYDLGVTEDETMYFVMELLEGMTLEALVAREGPLPPGRAIHILRQVCDSLAEAHAAGLVHRDIKPANIHIGRLGLTWDFVKVLDFGLVKATGEKADAVAAIAAGPSLATAGGLTPGTPAYMAPEMTVGEPVDSRADIYALGCVAYYLLTAKLVFEAENAVQVMLKHVTESPVPPSVRAGATMPEGLDQAVLACLAKEPGDRPRGALELGQMLADIRGAHWPQERAAEWWKRNAG